MNNRIIFNSFFIICLLFSFIFQAHSFKTKVNNIISNTSTQLTNSTTIKNLTISKNLLTKKNLTKLTKSKNSTKLTNLTNLTKKLNCHDIKQLDEVSFKLKKLIKSTINNYNNHLNKTRSQLKSIKIEREIGIILLNIKKLDGASNILHDLKQKSKILTIKKCNLFYLNDNIKSSNKYFQKLLKSFKSQLVNLKVKFLFTSNVNNQLVLAQITEKSTNNYGTILQDKRLINLFVTQEIDK
jgi:hypothetical protein